MIDAVTFVPLFSALVQIFMFSYVFGQRQRNASNNAFLLFSGCFGALCLIEFLIRIPISNATAVVLSRIGMVLFIPTPFLFLYFVHTVVRRPIDIIFKALLVFTILSSIASLFLRHHTINATAATTVPTLLYMPLFFAAMLSPFRAQVLLYKGWRKSIQEMVRRQSRLLFWGNIVSFGFAILFLVMLPLFWHQYTFYRFSSLATVIQSIFIYYAMTRYGLMVVDIYQIKKALEVLFHNVNDGIVTSDRHGTIVQINAIAQQLIPHSHTFKTFSQIEAVFPGIHFSDSVSPVKQTYTIADEEKTVIISHAPISDQKENLGHITVFHDISEQVKLERDIEQKTRIESLGRLAGGVAHDFNNQLAGIMGCADMLRSELAGNASLYELADIIVQAVHRSSSITKQMLAFARKGNYQATTLNIHEIISDVIVMLNHSIDKKIRIVQHLDAQLPIVKGDSSQLHNVILNISLNSRDAMPQGGELIFQTQDIEIDGNSLLVSQYDLSDGRYVLITVKDTGTGMKEHVLAKAFEPFFTTKKEGKGSGMGLSAAYGAIRNHNGAITIESAEGSGTTVSIYLPVTSDTIAANQLEPKESKSTAQQTILLIEDEKFVAVSITKLLQQAGHRLIVSKTGREAIDQYRDNWQEIDLIILDLVLPDINGYETFKALEAINPRLRVIVSSGYSFTGEAQRILDEGAMDFIQKPFENNELIQKINDLIKE